MKKLFTTLTALLLTLSAQVQADDFETAAQAVKNMGPGWNLGNTLDANSGNGFLPTENGYWGTQGLESETYWGQPVTKPELMKMMKEAGFGAIRVPVTWYNHMDKDGKVDAAWMARVKEVVDYVIDNGMYCIINVHHDTGADSGDKQGKVTSAHWIHASETNYSNNKDRYEGLWRQIAEEFKNYDQHLLFGGYNEMLDTVITKIYDDKGQLTGYSWGSWCFASFNASGQYNAAIAESAYKGLNGYAQSFVNAVRATGGNNAQRNLIINTYASANGGGNWNAHLTDVLTELEAPTDVTEGHIAYEVHAYPTLNSGKSELDDIIKKVNKHLAPKGPVIIGEWGTSNVDAAVSDYDAQREKYLDFAKYFIQQTKANNIATFYWMGLSDGFYRSQLVFNQADLAETIAKAWHGNGFEGVYPEPDKDAAMDYVVTYNSNWGELFLHGDWTDGQSISLSEYTGIRVELDADYTDKLQVKIYGKTEAQASAQPITGAVTTITFDPAVTGTVCPRITLQAMDTFGSGTATVKKSVLLKADGTEVVTTPTVAWGCTLEAVPSGIQTVLTNSSVVDDGLLYSLSGQRVTNPTKGIYIRNGKKFIVR